MDHPTQRILLTPGEPAGIGPDLCVAIAQQSWPVEIVAVVDPELLLERSADLNTPITLTHCDIKQAPEANPAGTLKYIPVQRAVTTLPGEINLKNSAYIIETLKKAAELCLAKKASALVTGPVQKSALIASGFEFQGHTEFLAQCAHVSETLMVFVMQQEPRPIIVALATTHLALKDVPAAITPHKLESSIRLLHQGLQNLFAIEKPHILMTGLNPHAGEGGYIGKEEIDIIIPVIETMRAKGYLLSGPYSADSIFLPQQYQQGHAILALYHDQALPVVKYASFGQAVNVTFGLPFIRTSVDHGTALNIAATGQADSSSLQAALTLATQLSRK